MDRTPKLGRTHAQLLNDFISSRYDDFVMHLIEVEPEEDAQATTDNILKRLDEIQNAH